MNERRHSFSQSLPRPAHVSHRGGAKLEPENTLAAFRLAVDEFHTDMLELDVHRTSDGVLVVHHDATVDRCTNGTGFISQLTLDQLRKLDAGFAFNSEFGTLGQNRGITIPTLSEVLQAFPNTRLNIELKTDEPNIETVFARELREHDALSRVCVGSEIDSLAHRLCRELPEACHFFPRDALTAFVLGVLSGEEVEPDSRFHIADMPAEYGGMPLITSGVVEAAHRHGLSILVWTIDDEAQMRTLLGAGVDGIMTDRPDVLRMVIASL